MPITYRVDAAARTGAELRVARGAHELEATGRCARLGLLLPHLTTTTTSTTDGRPLHVRLSYRLAVWLVAGMLVVTDEVASLLLYTHVLGAERLGAA